MDAGEESFWGDEQPPEAKLHDLPAVGAAQLELPTVSDKDLEQYSSTSLSSLRYSPAWLPSHPPSHARSGTLPAKEPQPPARFILSATSPGV